MIGGAGYVAGRSVAKSGQRESDQEQQLEAQQTPPSAPASPAQAAPAGGGTDIASKLFELKGLLDQGVLTQDEFEVAKQKLLAT
jgi:hypothetical protein